jgi:hypothetical protein
MDDVLLLNDLIILKNERYKSKRQLQEERG